MFVAHFLQRERPLIAAAVAVCPATTLVWGVALIGRGRPEAGIFILFFRRNATEASAAAAEDLPSLPTGMRWGLWSWDRVGSGVGSCLGQCARDANIWNEWRHVVKSRSNFVAGRCLLQSRATLRSSTAQQRTTPTPPPLS